MPSLKARVTLDTPIVNNNHIGSLAEFITWMREPQPISNPAVITEYNTLIKCVYADCRERLSVITIRDFESYAVQNQHFSTILGHIATYLKTLGEGTSSATFSAANQLDWTTLNLDFSMVALRGALVDVYHDAEKYSHVEQFREPTINMKRYVNNCIHDRLCISLSSAWLIPKSLWLTAAVRQGAWVA